MGVIYHLFCAATGKAYVGQTWDTIDKRWYAHCNEKHCVKLYRAIKKYGKERFVRSQLTGGLTTQADMDAAEAYWIGHFDAIKDGYNIREGGSHGRHSEESKAKVSAAKRGIPKTKEHKAKLSAANMGHIASPKARANMSAAKMGHEVSAETRARLSASNSGKERSEESIANISKAQKKRYSDPAERARLAAQGKRSAKPFVDQNGVRYESLREAAASLGVAKANVQAVLKGRYKKTKGYTFKYLDS